MEWLIRKLSSSFVVADDVWNDSHGEGMELKSLTSHHSICPVVANTKLVDVESLLSVFAIAIATFSKSPTLETTQPDFFN